MEKARVVAKVSYLSGLGSVGRHNSAFGGGRHRFIPAVYEVVCGEVKSHTARQGNAQCSSEAPRKTLTRDPKYMSE